MTRVLIVEDNDDIRGYLQTALGGSGYPTNAVASLSEAREVLEVEDFDVIVVDARLPDGRGLDLVAEASARGKKAIIISGHPPSMRAMDYTGITYLMKPFELPDLLAAIDPGANPPIR
jgi:DNA-binding NtrC family response regulator